MSDRNINILVVIVFVTISIISIINASIEHNRQDKVTPTQDYMDIDYGEYGNARSWFLDRRYLKKYPTNEPCDCISL